MNMNESIKLNGAKRQKKSEDFGKFTQDLVNSLGICAQKAQIHSLPTEFTRIVWTSVLPSPVFKFTLIEVPQ